ncbi:cardiotrophin-2-like isoform X1 [Scyliorhinus torazame]|uniref:cardiotrophin-2-like isoform X1 n=1 Tax=Scyliorhinus torazame TaxID=75743 RepID=UPI003B5B466F
MAPPSPPPTDTSIHNPPSPAFQLSEPFCLCLSWESAARTLRRNGVCVCLGVGEDGGSGRGEGGGVLKGDIQSAFKGPSRRKKSSAAVRFLNPERTMEIISRARFHRISTRSVTRNLSVTVHKTYKLVQELNHRSPRLVDLYRQHQGPPFNHPGFQPASPALPGLPAVSHGDEEEDGEGKEGIWLLSDHRAYTGLAHYLSLVLEDQRGLNPGRSRLLDELAYFTVNVQGLTVNLEHLASSLDHPRPGVEAYRQAWGPTGTSDWEKKLAGLEVCTRCARWLQASEEDFAALAAKHS